MKKFALGLALSGAIIAIAAPASAAVSVSSAAWDGSYTGPFTYDFDSPAGTPAGWANNVFTTNDANNRAQPLGSVGGYAAVGTNVQAGQPNPNTIDLTALGISNIGSISFLWGSIDSYNVLTLLDRDGNSMGVFGGDDIIDPANGNQTDPAKNRVVTFRFDGADASKIGGLQFFSDNQNAFEIDSVKVAAVPEPATWAMMIGGFGLIGLSMRRRTRNRVTVSLA